jgi:O-antigen/teichoic acid export membrane protein
MTRSKRFIAGLLSGYGSIAANIVFTMASIPLALHYLDKEQFGLWALAAQINGYLILLDLGMNGAVGRFIADHKDDVNGGEYGSHLLTGGMVFAIQGLLIAGLGIGFSWFAPALFTIPHVLSGDFKVLLMLLAGMSGLSVAFRAVGSPLWAFQRNDIVNHLSTLGVFANLILLWFGFSGGWGVISFAIAQIPMLIVAPAVTAWFCRRNGYYPSPGHWGKIKLSIFIRTFQYGRDVLMLNFGSQLINASQIMIISRWISLDAAATFAVSTKVYSMAMMVIANPIATAVPGLIEMHVRNEHQRFVERYWDLMTLVLAASTTIATALVIGNRSFISIWTHGTIQWPWACDFILALLIIMRNVNGCFLNLFGVTKDWRPVRYIYLAEGLVFVPLAILLSKPYGMTGILLASLIAHILATTTLSARAAGRIIGSLMRIRNGLMTSMGLIAGAASISYAGVWLGACPWIMIITAVGTSLLFLAVAWQMILPQDFRREASARFASASLKLKSMLTNAF